LNGIPLGIGNPLGGNPLSSPLDGVSDDFGSRNGSHLGSPLHIENPIASTLTEPTLPESDPADTDLSFREPAAISTDSWLDSPGKGVADHPLLRGLLLELPPKGANRASPGSRLFVVPGGVAHSTPTRRRRRRFAAGVPDATKAGDPMTTGSDDLGNGAAKTEDRFAGQLGYRPRGNRDGGSLPASARTDGPRGSGPLNGGPLNGTPLGGPLNAIPLGIGNPLSGSPLDGMSDDFGSRNGSHLGSPLHIENPIASTLAEPTLPESDPADADLSFREPVAISADSWLDSPGKGVADHPLLRGLLLELPPKGATLQVQWLDRWFEAARSILELLYRFEDKRD
jgi:hypothetical protein